MHHLDYKITSNPTLKVNALYVYLYMNLVDYYHASSNEALDYLHITTN